MGWEEQHVHNRGSEDTGMGAGGGGIVEGEEWGKGRFLVPSFTW